MMFQIYALIIALVLAFLVATLKILREYQRGVIFLLGRFWKVKGPGLIIVIPIIPADGAGRPAHNRARCADPEIGRASCRERV